MRKVILIAILAISMGLTYADSEGNVSETKETPTATIELKGQVVDLISGEALTGVEIRIDGTDLKVYTDFINDGCKLCS